MSLRLDVKAEGLEPILGAAYLLTDRAFVALEGRRERSVTVLLRPKQAGGKGALAALKKAFLRELETQKVRWAIARNNRPVREYIAEQAVLVASGRRPAEPAAQSEDLSAEQRAEIDRLIAEVEAEIKALGAGKAADPKGLRASWEESEGKPKG